VKMKSMNAKYANDAKEEGNEQPGMA